jgi:hypothetical protein
VIRTIDELIALTEREAASLDAEGFSSIAQETRLRTPGCTPDELARIRVALPGLPESYLAITARVSLPNITLGDLQLAPGPFNEMSLFDRLTEENGPNSPQWGFVNHHGLYHVASYPGSLVCVNRDGTEHPGEVFEVDYGWGGINDLQLRRVAWSFEQMMIGFGRIREQRLAEREGSEVVEAVLSSLQADFGLDDEQMEVWYGWVEEVLGGDVDRDDASEENSELTSIAIERLNSESLDYDADVVSHIEQSKCISASEIYASTPNWPQWMVESYTYFGLVVRQYWTKCDGQAYMLRQDYGAEPNPLGEPICHYKPKISVSTRKGWPRRDPVRNWTMHHVADYPLPGIEVGQEARVEAAAYRRHLPELLAKLHGKK